MQYTAHLTYCKVEQGPFQFSRQIQFEWDRPHTDRPTLVELAARYRADQLEKLLRQKEIEIRLMAKQVLRTNTDNYSLMKELEKYQSLFLFLACIFINTQRNEIYTCYMYSQPDQYEVETLKFACYLVLYVSLHPHERFFVAHGFSFKMVTSWLPNG